MNANVGNNRHSSVHKKLKYTEQALQNALAAIRSGMTVTRASTDYKIPRQTLRDKISGKTSSVRRHSGIESVLGAEIESRLASWLKQCARQGFGIDRNTLLDSVQKIVISNGLKTPFKDGRPNKTWFYSFMKRHKDLSQKRAEYLNRARGSVTSSHI